MSLPGITQKLYELTKKMADIKENGDKSRYWNDRKKIADFLAVVKKKNKEVQAYLKEHEPEYN